MSTLKGRYVAATVILCAFNSVASGETTDLLCTEYDRDQVKGGTKEAKVDLEHKAILTPLGAFEITKVFEDRIFFEGTPNPADWARGSLDRFSGEMNIFWGNPMVARFYRCELRKRLF